MPDTPGINPISTVRPDFVNQVADFAKGLNLSEKGQAAIRDVVALLATERNVRITNTPANARTETGTVNGPTGTPAIDDPDSQQSQEADLEKLLLYLQLDNLEQQAAEAKKRIEAQKDTLQTQHNDRLEKLKESLARLLSPLL